MNTPSKKISSLDVRLRKGHRLVIDAAFLHVLLRPTLGRRRHALTAARQAEGHNCGTEHRVERVAARIAQHGLARVVGHADADRRTTRPARRQALGALGGAEDARPRVALRGARALVRIGVEPKPLEERGGARLQEPNAAQ
eukprot:6977304-Prymnesium_polylepis.1